MWKTMVLAVLPISAVAQNYGDVALTQTYNTVGLDFRFGPNFDPTSLSTTYLRPVTEGGYLEVVCSAEANDQCWTVQYEEFGNAASHGIADPEAPLEDILATLTPVVTQDRVGGAVFLLKNGAEFSWKEVWRSDGFEVEYDMSLTV